MFRKHLLILILILILGLYLGAKALDEKSWDGWHFGSAQVLLSDKQWVENGFFRNYFLFIPQGYSKTVKYFDDPELRQHARGVTTGGFIGKRLYYTHYPSGFLLPTALLMKIGIEKRFWFRMLEILFSLGALAILYWIFTIISNRLVAFSGVLYYSISILFLDYADTLGNQPIDELLRFAIIASSIIVFKNQKKYLNYLIWILYFTLSLSSYDSTFFIFAWLVGLDLVVLRKIDFKKWIFWASAPVLAFGIQVLQNTWYLGWHDMFLDLIGTIKTQILGSRKDFFISHLQRLSAPFGWFFGVAWYLGILIAAAGMATIKFLKKHIIIGFDERFLYLVFWATLFHFLLFPSLFFHQARVVSIFGGLLIGTLTVLSTKILFKKELKMNVRIIFAIIFIVILGLWLVQAQRTYAYIKNWPNNIWPQENINFDKKIKDLFPGDKVIFQMSGFNREVTGSDRYPMAASEDEYYTDAPILGFTNTKDLVRDYNYLKNRSEFPFSAVMISDKKENLNTIRKNLKLRNDIVKIDNKFVTVIPK